MGILVIFGALICFGIVPSIFFLLAELIENARLASDHGDDVATLCRRLEALRIPEMRKDFDLANSKARASMGRLLGPDGKVINICPRCGGPVRSRPSYGGLYVSCIKQGCFGSENLDASDSNVTRLTAS